MYDVPIAVKLKHQYEQKKVFQLLSDNPKEWSNIFQDLQSQEVDFSECVSVVKMQWMTSEVINKCIWMARCGLCQMLHNGRSVRFNSFYSCTYWGPVERFYKHRVYTSDAEKGGCVTYLIHKSTGVLGGSTGPTVTVVVIRKCTFFSVFFSKEKGVFSNFS